MSRRVQVRVLRRIALASVLATGQVSAQGELDQPFAEGFGLQAFEPAPAGDRPGSERLAADSTGAATVTFAGFHVFEDGSSRIFLQLTRPVPVQVRRADRKVTYTLEGARIPVRNNKNPLVTKEFASPVMKAELSSKGSDAVLTITLRESAPTEHHMVKHRNGEATLHIDFKRAQASQ